MSTGKINRPSQIELPDRIMDKPLQEVIYEIAETCDVEVDNSDWENADNNIMKVINNLEETVENLNKKIGNSENNISDELSALKKELENLKNRKPQELAIKIDDREPINIGVQHFQIDKLLNILSEHLHVYIVGPAGSGKTTAAINCAKALGLKFYFTGAIASEYKLTGFMDANGRIVSTEFRKAYENGGLFLFDEIDASYPQAILAFNAALANDYMDFPDKRVEKHKDFYCIAAANTFGTGSDRQYVGRNQLDAASLDRFIFLEWSYDEDLERELVSNDEWVNFVQKIRSVIEELKIRHVVSPRASIFGEKLLEKGLDWDEVANLVIWKGLDSTTIEKIKGNL